MSAETEEKPVLLRFFDNFLQERNIKWLLALGMLILLASSVMLVTAHWDAAGYTPVWKYLTLIAYASGIYLASQWAYYKACLRKTGTVLMALTVLLAPLTFLALRWVQGEETAGFFAQGINLGLLALNFGLVAVAVSRTFRHFLHGPQPTFTVCFLGLCLAGALLPGIAWSAHPLLTMAAALLLWAIFAIGTVKVNRQVFWLMEAHKQPRIFGFFPMLLLGAQFLLLFALNFAGQIEAQWIGLGCVLTAVPILLAADRVAALFQQRTGNLERPYPWSILLPLAAGLLLTVAGVCLAGFGLRPPHVIPLALVPTAALAAGVMGLVARRTEHKHFIWVMLFLTALAYNFSYVFFQEAAHTVLHQGATAVHEARLPLAFYGLTYVPLLVALSGAAYLAKRRGQELFAGPLRTFCVSLVGLLLALACTNVKAELPVGAVLLLLSAGQAVLFRDRRLVFLAIGSWFVAAFGVVPFAQLVLELPVAAGMQEISLVLAAGLLLFPGRMLDRLVALLPGAPEGEETISSRLLGRPCESASLLGSLVLALWGVAWFFDVGGSPALWIAAAMLLALLVRHSLIELSLPLGPFVYGFALIAGGSFAVDVCSYTLPQLLPLTIALLLAQWGVTYFLARRPESRVSFVYLPTLQLTSLAGLTAAVMGISLWSVLTEVFALPHGTLQLEFPWVLRLLVTAWAFDDARRYCNPIYTILGTMSLYALVTSLLVLNVGPAVYDWLPLIWSILALIGIGVVEGLRSLAQTEIESDAGALRRKQLLAFIVPLSALLPAIQGCIALATLPFLGWPLRLAAVIAMAGLLLVARLQGDRTQLHFTFALLNWHLLVALVAILVPGVAYVPVLLLTRFAVIGLPIAFAAAVSLLLWQASAKIAGPVALPIGVVQRKLLRSVIVAVLSLSFFLPALSPGYFLLAMATFTLAALSELIAACQESKEERVWTAELIVLAAIGCAIRFDWIVFGHGTAMFIVLLLGVVAYVASHFVRRYPQTEILSRPLTQTGMCLPMLSVLIGIGRHLHYAQPKWLGMNSLALLLSAGFYAYQAIERKQTRYWVLAASILNIALMLLWKELSLTDPQFYCIPVGITILGLVQLLKREIPKSFHDPLRYCGALVILASPTINIVGGSWLHMVMLMLAAIGIVLVAIGLRVRALMYTGTAFLVADLVTMMVRGSLAHPNLLWVIGLGVGAAVVAFGAFCENHRELLQQRLRMISASMQQWE